ncbi:MAG: 30S ribosomal protein S12 methylthiotransferase RimO [Firmicutes bacterium]|nr:30S ribosomal protein S12 methylthiotransferase RimO [Bacillota bacterium]
MIRGRKVAAVALGCAQNRIDTEEILGLLGRCGCLITDDPARADLIIVNTCAFIEKAQQESIETILNLARRRGSGALLIAAGCLAQHYGAALLREIPELNGVIGVHSYSRMAEFLESCLHRNKGLLLLEPPSCYRDPGPRLLTTPPHSAYVKIAEGCDNRCCYCLIPSLRGPLRSRPPGEIITEIRQLLSGGAREINLIAQDTTAYGSDGGGSGSLPALLKQILQEITAPFWLRILYAHPARISDSLIELIARESRICKYLDLPLQHINSTVLRRMGRRYHRAEAAALIRELRQRVPGIVLRTTYLTGFPGESRADFRELRSFLQEEPIERVGIFAYSRQQGTAADLFPQQVPPRVARRRRRELLRLQQEVALQFHRTLIGKSCTALVEGPAGRGGPLYRGRCYHQAPEVDGALYFRSPRPLLPGSLVRVRITAASPYDLYGTALG